MRISYWSSDVCSSDLHDTGGGAGHVVLVGAEQPRMLGGLAADQGATGLDTGLGDALHDRGDALRHDPARGDVVRSEERRVGEGGVRRGRMRSSQDHYKRKNVQITVYILIDTHN